MINVFISHNYKDKPLARKIAGELIRYGIKPWLDESEIKLGDSLIEKIRDGLDNMDYLIALISENSVQSEWVKKELDIAMNGEIEGKKVRVIPILAGKCDLPGFLKGKLYLDMSTNRKYNGNIAILLKRFNVDNVNDDKNEFTDYKLTTVEVIEKMENTKHENDLIEFLENFSYSERNLFYRDTFVECLNNLLDNKDFSEDIIVSLISICKYCPDDYIKKINLTKFLAIKDKEILRATIKVLSETKSLKIQQKKIIGILNNCSNDDIINIILDFFATIEMKSEIAKEVYEFCRKQLKTDYNKKCIECLCKLSNYVFEDEVYEIWIDYWRDSDDLRKKELVNTLCTYGFQSEGVYLKSPKLRNEMKEILMKSFSESDTHNANIMIALLTSSGNIIESRKELWNKLYQIDDYSIQLTLEMLRDEYNIAYIFNSSEDLNGLKKLLDSKEAKIRLLILDVIAEIHSKEAIDIVRDTGEFVPQYYNTSSLIITLLKETNVVDYKEFYEIVKEKTMDGYCSKIDYVLIAICDFLIGESNFEQVIKSINHEPKDKIIINYREKTQVVIEKLGELKVDCDKKQSKKIQEFIDECKDLLMKK